MPKKYTAKERETIRKQLMKEAGYCLGKYGIRKTSVDEIVSRVGIPKGTFYLFYDHREDLFRDILVNFTEGLGDYFRERLSELDENHIVTSLTDIFTSIMIEIRDTGIFRMFESDGENIVFMRGKEDFVEVRKRWRGEFEKMFEYFYVDDRDEIEKFSKSFESLCFLYFHEERIGDIQPVMKNLIRGMVLQMVES